MTTRNKQFEIQQLHRIYLFFAVADLTSASEVAILLAPEVAILLSPEVAILLAHEVAILLSLEVTILLVPEVAILLNLKPEARKH